MKQIRPTAPGVRPLRVSAFLALAWLGLAAGRARAQDDFDVPEDAAVDNGMMQNVVIMNNQNNAEMFDQWVFNQVGGPGQAHNRLDSLLSLKLDDLERFCRLSPVQRKKLELAGRGDVKRFFNTIDEQKRKWAKIQDNNGNIWNDVQPLQTRLTSGIFDQDSLFTKALHGMLTSEQSSQYDELALRRRREHYDSMTAWFVVHLDKGMGFSHEQSDKFLALIRAKTRPPKRFGQSDYYYMIYQVSRIDENDLRPIFSEQQWKALSQQIQQGKGMLQWLKNQGVVEDDPPPQKKAEVKKAQVAPMMLLKPAEPAVREEDRKAGQAKADAREVARARDQKKSDAQTKKQAD